MSTFNKVLLTRELEYNEQELEELTIEETKLNQGGDNVIYLALSDQEQVKEIFKRKAELKNDRIIVRHYIPPNLFDRFSFLNKVCKDERAKDTNLKTQIRYGKKDIEIYMKYRGDDTPYRLADISDFVDPGKVPPFDHRLKWRRIQDKPPRRKLTGQPAGRKNTDKDPVNPLIRQHSNTEKLNNTTKKAKLNSSSSSDGEEDEEMDNIESDKDDFSTPSGGKNTTTEQL